MDCGVDRVRLQQKRTVSREDWGQVCGDWRCASLVLRNSWCLRLESYALPEFCRVVHAAVGDDVFDIASIVNVLKRIGVDEDQIGALSDFDGAQFFVEAHDSGRYSGCCLNGLHRSESRLNVEFDFAMQTVSGDRLIGACDDGNSGTMQSADDREIFLKYLLADFRVLVGRTDIGKRLGEFRGQL